MIRTHAGWMRGAVAGAALALALGGAAVVPAFADGAGGGAAGDAAAAGAPTTADQSVPADGDAAAEQGAVLYIGGGSDVAEVAAPDVACTPDALIAAIAAETGWDLALAEPAEVAENGSVTVAFAEGHGIYSEPPEPQKDAYHVFEARDYVFSVLNSVGLTLLGNTDCTAVHFSAPDGGPLAFSNGGYDFYVSQHFWWGWGLTAEDILDLPLPEDSIGLSEVYPNGYALAGGVEFVITLERESVELGAGTVVVTDAAGAVVESFDVPGPGAAVERVALTEQELGLLNMRTGTSFAFSLSEALQPGETYTVSVPAGAFVSGDLASKAFGWDIACLDYGVAGLGLIDRDDYRLGDTVSYDIVLGESVERAVVAAAGPVSDGNRVVDLTESGTVSFTPAQPGEFLVDLLFELEDGSVGSASILTNVAPAAE